VRTLTTKEGWYLLHMTGVKPKIQDPSPLKFINIGTFFSAALAECTFRRQFCLIPSLEVINRSVVGCQEVELKIAEGGLTNSKEAQKPPKSPGLLLPG
jgi:hypothetical protein